MITEHPLFTAPSDKNIWLWRYMDLSKFIALLQDKALYFPRADKLGDPFEGSLTAKDIELRQEETRRDWGAGAERISELHAETNRMLRDSAYISCWHMNEHESAAMWRLYSQSSDAVAIRTTYAVLASLLPEQAHAGAAIYYDPSTESADPKTGGAGNIFNPLIRKRKSYEHERELRAVILLPRFLKDTTALPSGISYVGDGLKVSVDLNRLIQDVFVSPASPEWFKRMVQGLGKSYDLMAQVSQSSLDDKALF